MALFDTVLRVVPAEKRDVALAAGGMAAILTGQKLTGLVMFGKGVYGLEKQWRLKHPGFDGTWSQRFAHAAEHYEATHRNPTNRVLHMVGIPMILGGTVGLLASPRWTPPWFLSAGAFAGGWALNFVGHFGYEKNRPAFEEDPLSFVAGPVWDLQQVAGTVSQRFLKRQPA